MSDLERRVSAVERAVNTREYSLDDFIERRIPGTETLWETMRQFLDWRKNGNPPSTFFTGFPPLLRAELETLFESACQEVGQLDASRGSLPFDQQPVDKVVNGEWGS